MSAGCMACSWPSVTRATVRFLAATAALALLTIVRLPAQAQNVVTTNTVGDSPWGVAVNAASNHIYVANHDSQNVSVIDGTSNSVVAVPTATPTNTATPTPTATLTWMASTTYALPLVMRNYMAPEPPLPLVAPLPVGTVEAGGMAVVDVVNDTPYGLTLKFVGPTQDTTVMNQCEVCRVYSFIGPIFCPTQDRPRTDVYLMPGTYQVRASVDDPDIRDYGGTWSLTGNTKYFLCFYIVRTLTE